MNTEMVDFNIQDYIRGFNLTDQADVNNHNKICFIYNKEIVRSIQQLDHFRYLEDILLPIYKSSSVHSKEFNMSMALMISYKKDSVFEYLRSHEGCFKMLFEEMTDYSIGDLNGTERIVFIDFLINCYQHIEERYITSICMKLISILLVLHLNKNSIKKFLKENDKMVDKFKVLSKLGDKKSEILNSKAYFFFPKLLDAFIETLMTIKNECNNCLFYEKFIEFTIDLLSQIPTRRFILPLLNDTYFLEYCTISQLYMKEIGFKKLVDMLRTYMYYEINEQTGENLSLNAIVSRHHDNIMLLQTKAFKLFPEKLNKVYIKTVSLIESRENLRELLDTLNDDEVRNLFTELGLDGIYGKKKELADGLFKELLYEIFYNRFESKTTILDKINNCPLFPTEKLLFSNLFESYMNELDDTEGGDMSVSSVIQRPLPIPKLNLQFLSHYDYLLRNFQLFQLEAIYSVKLDIEDVANKISPQFEDNGQFIEFHGWSKMAIPIKLFKILSIKQPTVGNLHTEEVLAEIDYNLNGVQTPIKLEWDRLKKFDVLFLITFERNEGNSFNIKYIRGCEVHSVYDQDNNEFSDYENILTKKKPLGNARRAHIKLDNIQYDQDMKDKEINIEELYSGFHLLVRRKPKENNFKAILETIRDLMNSKTIIPKWLQNIFLGYGDPKGAHYTRVNGNLNEIRSIDFKDTFLDREHYVDTIVKNDDIPKEVWLKRDEPSFMQSNLSSRRNDIRFTKKQIEAIVSSVYNGLNVIVGPPGTGKTDVAVQIVNLLYHNFPNQRTLIVTHSNYALNDIFEKISKLDINERHLLRLGMGEKDLDLEKDFSKIGRVDFMLSRRLELLADVLQLANSIKVYTHQEYTCETALYFYKHHILRLLDEYKNNLRNEEFPLLKFFRDVKGMTDINTDLMTNYIESMFKEIEEVRTFEILRNNYERGNYLLTTQAKIVAMTCTYAALKRKEFIRLDFEYDNIIVEEAGQILEVETFIPLLLQENKTNESRLKRVILIGDHNQLPPIVRNNAYRSYSKMDQSLYTRFIRTGVPTINLNWQGRSRPTMVDLYRWRYNDLNDLDVVKTGLYGTMNPGFNYEYQFINIDAKEYTPTPYFYQNLNEAEYIVATYMYMCLKGYDPNKITILTTYKGQKFLIKDIIKQKCEWNPQFKTPHKITTVDKYQGRQNDYILLSLVRTKNVGHIRDVRRLVVALSRARLGLYVFGYYGLFKDSFELRSTFSQFEQRPMNLSLLIGENFPTERKSYSDNVIEIQDYRHMYRVVQELLKIKLQDNK
jgi:intron-binding protein aquarius